MATLTPAEMDSVIATLRDLRDREGITLVIVEHHIAGDHADFRTDSGAEFRAVDRQRHAERGLEESRCHPPPTWDSPMLRVRDLTGGYGSGP